MFELPLTNFCYLPRIITQLSWSDPMHMIFNGWQGCEMTSILAVVRVSDFPAGEQLVYFEVVAILCVSHKVCSWHCPFSERQQEIFKFINIQTTCTCTQFHTANNIIIPCPNFSVVAFFCVDKGHMSLPAISDKGLRSIAIQTYLHCIVSCKEHSEFHESRFCCWISANGSNN